MAIRKETGIIIQSKDIGDSDRLISLAGESQVRMNFISKGIRKSKRRAIISTEIGCLVEVDFYDQAEKDWKSTKEIHLIKRFDELKSDYIGTLFVFYITELTSQLYPEGENHPFLFQLLSGSLETSNTNGFRKEILPFFKIRALTHMGHFPSEFYCHTCGEEVLTKSKAYFSVDSREFLCSDCHPISKDHLPVLKLFHTMLSKKFSNVLVIFPREFEYREGDMILNQFIRSLFGKELKSYFEFYRTIGDL
ncbi:recombinational DNA repair protein [Leptospira ellinghausenii]|uniref:DNA repair protein RecO n=1 Tax=Leptospira ellinghausenii TaxID=1917822 RepID=A0A2P2D9G2_9LEPT|nr:DNA repair protein RecO [Leptospira ellinghausenii]GBF41266.1 recombinational DNA repair protein [Leptospira ellinghausenii]